MKDLFLQSRKTFRYVAFKRLSDLTAPIAVVATAILGIWAGIVVLIIQTGIGTLVDLAFMAAVKENGG
jgi:hypothetical protein